MSRCLSSDPQASCFGSGNEPMSLETALKDLQQGRSRARPKCVHFRRGSAKLLPTFVADSIPSRCCQGLHPFLHRFGSRQAGFPLAARAAHSDCDCLAACVQGLKLRWLRRVHTLVEHRSLHNRPNSGRHCFVSWPSGHAAEKLRQPAGFVAWLQFGRNNVECFGPPIHGLECESWLVSEHHHTEPSMPAIPYMAVSELGR